MAQSAADWMMLDRFVYRKDDKEAFPDESSAPFRASSCTSLGKSFEVALLPANPPAISSFFVRWPGGTKPEEGEGIELVTAHLDLLLLRLTSIENLEESPYLCYTQDHFLCIASSDPKPHLQLKRLAVCREQVTVPPSKEEEKETVLPLVFFPNTVGLIGQLENGDDKDGFVVAQLAKVSQNPENSMMEAEVCVLRSCLSSDDGDGRWVVEKIEIQHKEGEFSDLWYWSTDDVVTFNKCICWVDYHRGGILFYDTHKEKPTISYLGLKMYNRRTNSTQCQALPQMNRSLCVTVTREIIKTRPMRGSKKTEVMSRDVLKFVDVARSDNYIFGPFELGSGFTIKSSTILSLDSGWVEDVSTSFSAQDLWASNTSSGLPHDMLMFPLASMLDNNIVYFLVSHNAKGIKKVSVVTLDMNNKQVLAVDPYITGKEDADMIKEKSHLLKGFISSRFPMFLNSEQGKQKELKYTARMPMASASSA